VDVTVGERKLREWGTTPARRRQILDAALACFDEKGVAATTIDDICSTAGISVGSIYHHFAGKEDIFRALVSEGLAAHRAGMVRALERGKNLEDSVRRLVRFHVRVVEERPALTRLMLQWEEAERAHPEGREHYNEYSDALGAWLRLQARAGHIRRMHPDLYSALLMGPLMQHARQRSADMTTASKDVLERGLIEGLLLVLRP
jgi:AcrR family transcriptional regulator